MRSEQKAAFAVDQPIIANRLVWMAVHGTLCLGLRHPSYVGPSRRLVEEFVRALGDGLVAWGCLTAEELELVQKTEAEESPHGFQQ